MSQILVGKNSVIEALKARRRKIEEIYLEGNKGIPQDSRLAEEIEDLSYSFTIVDRRKMESLATTNYHQGIIARVGEFPYSSLEEILHKAKQKSLLIMCDSIKDPQNFGTICRSAYCFGADGIILNKDNSVEITPVVSRASAGAVEYLPIAKVTNLSRTLEELKNQGFWSYAAVAKAPQSLESLSVSDKMVVVVGSEGEGIRRLVLETCDVQFSIPMARKFDSLNVAQALTVIMFSLSQKRL